MNERNASKARKRFRDAVKPRKHNGIPRWGRTAPSRQRLRLLRDHRRKKVEYIIRYQSGESMPDRINARAAECDITPEQLIHRAITQYMGDYGLKPLPKGFEPSSLRDLFEASGLLKPPNN